MRQEYSSETLLKPATLYFSLDGEEGVVGEVEHRAVMPKGVSRAALDLARVNPDAAAMTPERDADQQTIWSKVFNFIIEGFAIGGASFDPVNDFLRDDRWPEEEQKIRSAHGQRVTAMYPVPHPEGAPQWNWWASSREVATEIGEHLRKERDIKRAVDALSEFDDKTLRDIGIPHRSRIEYVVRYCHDC
jgi:uncharacterized protein YjiS (DUF1127 family)